MNSKYLIALLASSVIVTACEQQAEKTAKDAPAAAAPALADKASASGEMKLAASTSSEEARKHYMAGWTAFEMARNNAANDHFKKATAADPSFAVAHLMTALSATSTEGFASNLTKAGEHAAGASRGERLLIEAFQHAFANDQASQLVSAKALTALHPDSPRAWVFLAQAQGNQNDTAGAIDALNKALALDPTFTMAHMQLGNAYMFLEPKDFTKAEAHIKKAVALAPNEPNPHDLLGDVHRAQGNLKAAYSDYTKAAELAPTYGSPLQQRGHVNSFLGNYDAARADYTKAAELETVRGTNNGPFFLVFRSYVSLHEGAPAAAIMELKKLAASVDATNMEGMLDLKINALTNVVQIATHMGDKKTSGAAIADVTTLMRQQANDVGTEEFSSAQEANIAYLEGMLAARMGDAKGAQAKAATFETHVASNTSPRKLERMHEIQGMSEFYQKNYAAAAKHLASGNVVNNMYTKYHLAVAHEKVGNADEARKLFNELAVWNFNGAGYAMTRRDILARVSAG